MTVLSLSLLQAGSGRRHLQRLPSQLQTASETHRSCCGKPKMLHCWLKLQLTLEAGTKMARHTMASEYWLTLMTSW